MISSPFQSTSASGHRVNMTFSSGGMEVLQAGGGADGERRLATRGAGGGWVDPHATAEKKQESQELRGQRERAAGRALEGGRGDGRRKRGNWMLKWMMKWMMNWMMNWMMSWMMSWMIQPGACTMHQAPSTRHRPPQHTG